MAKTRIGSNATFSGPQKGLTIIGNHCYAYSGNIAVTGGSSANTELLKFNTGKGYIIGNFQPYSTERGNAQLYLAIKLNNQLVVNAEFDAEGSVNPMLDSPITLLIPPLTDVQVLVGIETGTNKNWSMTFTGRVYDA